MNKVLYNYAHKIFHFLWGLFITGFLTLLPLALTIALFHLTFSLLKSWLAPIAALKPQFLNIVPHAEIIIVIAFIFLIGTLLNIFLLRSIIHAIEELIASTPIIRPIYSGIKQFINAFTAQDGASFKQVVLIEFPRKGIYSVGFLTKEFPATQEPDKKLFTVFVPTTPNPTTGYLAIVAQDELVYLDISRQEAMALIISGGIIMPEKLARKN